MTSEDQQGRLVRWVGGSESVEMCGLGAMYMNDLGGSGGSAGAPSQVGGGDESVTHESVG